jgi:hypothetical protein
MSISLAVVIPTRNRAEMAIAAIRSLIEQEAEGLRVFVSDNSSASDQVDLLSAFCHGLEDPRVTYWRAPADSPQGSHWDWAVRQALARSDASHVTVHYDRKVTRPGQVALWLRMATRFPDSVFTYVTDGITSAPPPLRLWQPPWTGRIFLINTRRTAAVTARGEALEIGHALPVLSNCFVPRTVVESIVKRFGTLCESTTADSCFAYRFCALHDEYLHLDRSMSILYGSHRSAALGYLSGGGGDFADYRRTWRGESWLDAAPVPGLNLGYNMLFHEYELVRREVGDRLPPLDRAGCLRDLGRGLSWVVDPDTRAALREGLIDTGWDGVLPEFVWDSSTDPSWRERYRRVRQALTLFLADRVGVRPSSISGFAFSSDEEALGYALRYPSRPVSHAAHLSILEPTDTGFALP